MTKYTIVFKEYARQSFAVLRGLLFPTHIVVVHVHNDWYRGRFKLYAEVKLVSESRSPLGGLVKNSECSSVLCEEEY